MLGLSQIGDMSAPDSYRNKEPVSKMTAQRFSQ